MNDIEILENLEKYISFANKQENFSHDTDYKWHKELASMIENLIQRNKNLEQIEKEHKKENGRLRDKIKELEEIDLTTVYMDGIYDERNKWKIKVKEKIEELNKEEKKALKGTKGQDRYSIKLEYMHKRNALQELLEESER